MAYVERDGEDHLLALCEGNRCKGGDKGSEPGEGRIQVFQKQGRSWEHIEEIQLPEGVRCEDYSGLDVDGDRVAVVSQQCSALWIGKLKDKHWEFCDDPGTTYHFPRTTRGRVQYCNVEGIAWTGAGSNEIVVVSDRRKKDDQPEGCEGKDQSIHIFQIPRCPD